jgi:hypothetical protein
MSRQGKPARFFGLDEVGHEKAATGELRRTGKQAELRGGKGAGGVGGIGPRSQPFFRHTFSAIGIQRGWAAV